MPDSEHMTGTCTPLRHTLLPRLLLAVVVVALLIPNLAHAQASEAVRESLTSAEWETETVAEGVVWKRAQLRLLGSPQSVNVLDVDLDAPGVTVEIVASDTGRALTSAMAQAAGAVAAVNGSFFDMQNGKSGVFYQQDGQVIEGASRQVGGERQEAAIAMEADGDAAVIQQAEQGWAQLSGFADVLASGPLLVWNGQPAQSEEDVFNETHHPRTVVGLTPDNHLLLVTVDGRSAQAAGMTIRELTWLMQGLGSSHALNLDGGGSTTMWVHDKGVVNYPSDNKKFDHEGERTVANAIIVRVRNSAGE